MAFPSTLTAFTDPTPSNKLNSPSHSSIESAQNTGLEEIQAFIGTTNTSTIGTILYDIRAPGSDGGGHIQSANKGGTGQTSFNKGDILVATSSSVLTKLAVGTDNHVLQADSAQAAGIKWASNPGGGVPTIRVFSVLAGSPTSSIISTWNKPSVLAYIVVETQGGGGGGGNSNGTGTGASGGGGGGGGYGRKVYNASVLSLTETVVSGFGGPVASVGGWSSFGTSASSIRSSGGGGGVVNGTGGTGGTCTGGDVNLVGGAGMNGYEAAGREFIGGGLGGGAILGGGGLAAAAGSGVNNNGSAGGNFGGGGGGAHSDAAAGHAAVGGVGGPGAVIIYEY